MPRDTPSRDTLRRLLPLATLAAGLALGFAPSRAQEDAPDPVLVIEPLQVEWRIPEGLDPPALATLEAARAEQATSGVMRSKVPGGWLVFFETPGQGGLVFYPDPEHRWTGGSPD